MKDEPKTSLEAIMIASLLAMDEEASTTINGVRTGLVDYAGHLGISTKCYEVPIYRRLAEMLRTSGVEVSADVAYEDDSGRACDLLITPTGYQCWYEVKVLWREWLSTESGDTKNWTDDSYVLGPGPGRRERSHSLAQDFEKLESIATGHRVLLGVLGICFDSARNSLDPVIHRMMEECRLRDRGWHLSPRVVTPDRNSTGHRIVFWFWWREHDQPVSAVKPSRNEVYQEDTARLTQFVSDALDFEAKATRVLRPFLARRDDWAWESWVSNVVDLPEGHPLVLRLGGLVRENENPYRAAKYQSSTKVEALTMFLLQAIQRELRRT